MKRTRNTVVEYSILSAWFSEWDLPLLASCSTSTDSEHHFLIHRIVQYLAMVLARQTQQSITTTLLSTSTLTTMTRSPLTTNLIKVWDWVKVKVKLRVELMVKVMNKLKVRVKLRVKLTKNKKFPQFLNRTDSWNSLSVII